MTNKVPSIKHPILSMLHMWAYTLSQKTAATHIALLILPQLTSDITSF